MLRPLFGFAALALCAGMALVGINLPTVAADASGVVAPGPEQPSLSAATPGIEAGVAPEGTAADLSATPASEMTDVYTGPAGDDAGVVGGSSDPQAAASDADLRAAGVR
jgi:hypothetical protein